MHLIGGNLKLQFNYKNKIQNRCRLCDQKWELKFRNILTKGRIL